MPLKFYMVRLKSSVDDESSTFICRQFHFFKEILDDAGRVGGGGEDAAHENVPPKVLVTNYLATTKVFNSEMSEQMLI
jgi:hypothetical protein